MNELRGRGRPKSPGTLRCDHCQSMVAKIRVRWPDSAVCGACFSSAVNSSGSCAHCHDFRLLPGRSAAGEDICRDCAGITTNLTCSRCGAEAERRRGGHCARCIVVEDLTGILKPNDPPDLRLHRLIGELASTERPRSIVSWMRMPAARALLDSLGDRTLELSHAAFDALPPTHATEHLREMLVHHRILPSRGDIRLARFESWLETRLNSFGGLLAITYGTALTRVVSLQRDAVTLEGDITYLCLGTEPIKLPAALGAMLRQLLDSGTTLDRESNIWIFKGRRAGRHLTTATIRGPLTRRGINLRAARNVALMSLARDLPPSVLAELLGISIFAADRWSAHSGHDWTDYPRVRIATGPIYASMPDSLRPQLGAQLTATAFRFTPGRFC